MCIIDFNILYNKTPLFSLPLPLNSLLALLLPMQMQRDVCVHHKIACMSFSLKEFLCMKLPVSLILFRASPNSSHLAQHFTTLWRLSCTLMMTTGKSSKDVTLQSFYLLIIAILSRRTSQFHAQNNSHSYPQFHRVAELTIPVTVELTVNRGSVINGKVSSTISSIGSTCRYS